jgi:D-threo-aldose 1-dehydrogenase
MTSPEQLSSPDLLQNHMQFTVKGQKAHSERWEGLKLPKIVFGTSSLGNLFQALDENIKIEIVNECFRSRMPIVAFDSAGKYGAGLALETLGKCLRHLNIPPENIIISNKLGWYRTDLINGEPTFEPGVWKNLKHDAVQRISYGGILDCFEQGNELLKGYPAQLVSVHDPDEYLRSASNLRDSQQRYNDILDAYKALEDLKQQGKVRLSVLVLKTGE